MFIKIAAKWIEFWMESNHMGWFHHVSIDIFYCKKECSYCTIIIPDQHSLSAKLIKVINSLEALLWTHIILVAYNENHTICWSLHLSVSTSISFEQCIVHLCFIRIPCMPQSFVNNAFQTLVLVADSKHNNFNIQHNVHENGFTAQQDTV